MGEAEGSAGDRYSPLKGGHAMFTNRVFRWAVLAVVVLGCALVVRVLAEEADKKPVRTEPLVLCMYNVSDIAVDRQDHPLTATAFPVIEVENRQSPTVILPDPPPRPYAPAEIELIAIIQRTVNNQSDSGVAAWSDAGGAAAIEYMSPVLIITQTPAAHKRIEELLARYRQHLHSRPMVTVRAAWVQVEADKARKLLAGQPGGDPMVVSPAVLEEAAVKTVAQGHVQCRDGQTVHLLSGEYQVYMDAVTPVVSDGAVGIEPKTQCLFIGAALQVEPVLSPDGQSATLDLYSYVVDLREMRSKPLPDFAQVKGVAQPMKIDLELPSVLVHTFATTAKVPLGKPVLIGGMTQPGAEKGKILCLVLEVTAAK